METTSRRTVLKAGLITGSAALAAAPVLGPLAGITDSRATAAAQPLTADPFTLGIASGDPSPDGFVIWTRLALAPVNPDGLGGMPSRRYEVVWQVATDPAFSDVVRAGAATAGPESAHAVHITLTGLQSGREYYYRFRQGKWLSGSGRAVTAPAYDTTPASLAMAFVSCSNFPAGFFTAYRHLANERPDLVLHLGDYQYEGAGNGTSRQHHGPETRTLANYRQRHAQYKTDPDLQAAHAAAPWLVVWDDHELENNYADDVGAAGRPARPHGAPGRGVPRVLREHAAAAYVGPGRSGHAAVPPRAVGPAGQLPHARHPAVPLRPGLQ